MKPYFLCRLHARLSQMIGIPARDVNAPRSLGNRTGPASFIVTLDEAMRDILPI